jgi:signal recognition particle GTPase
MFTNFASNKMNESKEKQFQKMIDSMVNAEKWTFRTWKGMLEDQLSSWAMYIPGVGNSKDAEGLKELKVMLDAMTEEELDNPEKVNGIARERIAKTSGKPIEKVRSLVFLHKNTQFYHLVLKMRKAAGDRMPNSPTDMNKLFEEDPRVKPIFQQV